jgi:AcrR family transcriptional regulator
MAVKTEDRRSRRSKRLLKQGLAELMLEKPFQEISVRDITDRMDLNRGTFYLHYADTYDLLQKLQQDTLDNVQAMIDEHSAEASRETLRPVFEPILNYIVENKDVCYALFAGGTASSFVDQVHRLIYKNGVSIIQKQFSIQSDETLDYLLSFVTYGLIGLIKEWFDTDMSLDKQEILRMTDHLVGGAAKRLLGVD